MMIEREWLIYLSMATLMWVGFYHGYRFVKLHNHLLGLEWIILATSATFGVFFVSDLIPQIFPYWSFLDLFSKLVGVTLIGALGIMRVTHRLEISMRTELLIFAIGFIISLTFLLSETLYATVELVSFLTGLVFIAALIILSMQSFKYGLALHGWAILLSIGANLALALWRDFSGEGGGSTMNMESVAFLLQQPIWAVSFAAVFYAYQALAQRKGVR